MQQSLDVIRRVKPPAIVDWDALFWEFVYNDVTPAAKTFLREVKHWPEGKILSGNTLQRIEGWSNKRAAERQRIVNDRNEFEKAKFEAMLPKIREAKAQIINDYLDALQNGAWIRVKDQRTGKFTDKRRRLNLRERSHILSRLKTELGEPSVITKNNVEDVTPFDPLAYLLEAYGITQDGRLKIDDSVRANPVIEG